MAPIRPHHHVAFNFVTIQPNFTFVDKAKALPIMEKFIQATKTEAGCLYYGWTIADDKFFCREAYVDGDAGNAHLANVGGLIGEILDGAATLDNISIHGPAAELEKMKEGTAKLGTVYYETWAGFAAFEGRSAFEFVTIQPNFTIVDKPKAEGIMARFVEATKTEPGCQFYGWTLAGDKLFCRESYVDGDAANAHLANVGGLIGEILDGAATLDSISIHGPAGEIEKTKEGTAKLGTVYYETFGGFHN